MGLGFRVYGFRCRVWDLGFGASDFRASDCWPGCL